MENAVPIATIWENGTVIDLIKEVANIEVNFIIFKGIQIVLKGSHCTIG
jgi:hypothetical protein